MSSTTPPLKLAVVIASVREGRFGPVVATWFLQHAEADADFEVTVVDLAETGPDGPPVSTAIGEADAIVLVTPEYNHSFPGVLKVAIDALSAEWVAKPVAFVSYGGLSGGLRSVEALRPVLSELNAVPIRDTISFHDAGARFDADGALVDVGHQASADAAAAALLTSLAWWATTLREGRETLAFGTRA
jgi:NAD(P)H-dependent FMN reductase